MHQRNAPCPDKYQTGYSQGVQLLIMDNTRHQSHHLQKLFIKYPGQIDYGDLSHAEAVCFDLSTQNAFSTAALGNTSARSAKYPAITDPDKKSFYKHTYNIFSSGYLPESWHRAN
jgi:hypothetical protein